jgi:hypothetical protein
MLIPQQNVKKNVSSLSYHKKIMTKMENRARDLLLKAFFFWGKLFILTNKL